MKYKFNTVNYNNKRQYVTCDNIFSASTLHYFITLSDDRQHMYNTIITKCTESAVNYMYNRFR